MKLSPAGIDGEVKIMRYTLMIAMAFLCVSFCAFQTSTVSAQTRTCSLALDVATTNWKFQTSPVDGVRATAWKSGSQKSIPATLSSGQPVFSNLTDGEYRITVTKRGFKRAIQPINFKCELADAPATMQVDLEPGSSRRSIVAGSQSISAKTFIVSPSIGETVLVAKSNLEKQSEGLGELVKPQPPTPQAVPKGATGGGVLNGKAIILPKPAYPQLARSVRAQGTILVQVTIDEEGNVTSAQAISGHPLLLEAARAAALGAKFTPTRLSGQAVKVVGVITYSFVLPKEKRE